MLADELKKAAAEYKAFKMAVAAGNNDVAKVAPVWKQLITSIFSWQTALVAAITLLSVYGKDIIEWTKKLFGAGEAIKNTKQLQDELNQSFSKNSGELSKLIIQFKSYQRQWKELAGNLQEQQKFIEKNKDAFDSMGVSIKSVRDAENLFVDNTDNFINSLKLRAQATAAQDLAAEEYKKAIQKEIEADKIREKASETRKKQEIDATGVIQDTRFGNIKSHQQLVEDRAKSFDHEAEAVDRDAQALKRNADAYFELGKAKEQAADDLLSSSGIEKYDKYEEDRLKKAQQETERQKKEAEKQKEIQERINQQLLDLQNKNQQSRINLMEEGSDKRIAQIEYDYDREIEAIRKREKEWREAQGGKLTQEQTVEIKTAITQAQATRMRSTQEVENEQIEAQRKAMNDYLKEYGTYQDKKMALAAEYGQKIAFAETEGEKLILGKEWDKQLSDLEIKSGNTANAIIALFGDMKDKTLKELIEISTKGKEALEFLKSGEWDESKGKGLGITQEQFDLWSDMPEIMDRAGKSVESTNEKVDELRPAFDKVTEGVRRFFAAGDDPKKLTESLQLINEGVNEVMTSVQFLSTSFRKLSESIDINAIEEVADGFETIFDSISSGMEGAISGEKFGELAASIGKKLGVIGEKAASLFGPIGTAAGAAIGVVTSLASSIAKIHDKKNEKRIQRLQDQIDVLDASYEKLGRSIEKAYSTSAAKLINQQDELLKQQKLMIQQQILEEKDKKKTDEERIKEWEKQLDDINLKLEDNKEKAIEAITGTDVMSAIDEFAQAYSEAWATGTDAAEASTKIVQNLIKTAIIGFLKDKLSPSVEEFMKKLADYMSDGIVSPWEEAELNKLKEKMDAEAQKVFDTSSKYFQEDKNDKYEQTATSGGFEKMSQDSADELNGRFTALQMTGEEILLFLQGSEQFLSLLYIKASMDVISVKIASLYDVADETRTMIASIYIELQQINDNTANTVIQLKKAVDKLTSIETNTKNM